jgi:hypothetical protein
MSEPAWEGFRRSLPADETGQLRRIALPGRPPYHGGPFGAHVHRSLRSLAGEPDAAETR